MDRCEKILRGLDLKRSIGLEIGPLANPMVRKSDGGVLYLDYGDTGVQLSTEAAEGDDGKIW